MEEGWPQLAGLYACAIALPRRITLYIHTVPASEAFNIASLQSEKKTPCVSKF